MAGIKNRGSQIHADKTTLLANSKKVEMFLNNLEDS